jgi:hypothetical protein
MGKDFTQQRGFCDRGEAYLDSASPAHLAASRRFATVNHGGKMMFPNVK